MLVMEKHALAPSLSWAVKEVGINGYNKTFPNCVKMNASLRI